MNLKLIIILITAYYAYANDIIAYDCADPNVKISKISLLGVKSCIDPKKSSKEEVKEIQLLQQNQYISVHVYGCLVTVQQIVQHCGILSHPSAIDQGFNTYVHLIKPEECKNLHLQGNKFLNLRKLKDGLNIHVQLNSTIHESVTIKGTLDSRGNCQGTNYNYNGIEYNDVIVTAGISIKLRDYTLIVNTDDDSIILRNGAVCKYSANDCFDDVDGQVIWDISDRSTFCSKNNFDILYTGNAKLLTLADNSKYIIVNTKNTTFALNLVKEQTICSKQVWRTEQSRLGIIFEVNNRKREPVFPQNANQLAFVLSKLLYLQIAFENKMQDMIYESIRRRCQLRADILRNHLALVYSSPDVVSTLVKEASGHIGRIMGEVLYVVRCIPKVVKFRKTKQCYQELPIIFGNRSAFMMPITHVIQEHGTEIDCNKNMPAMMYLQNKWLQFDPDIRQGYPIPFTLDANNPNDIIPNITISFISNNGIYTTEEMKNFQRALLFPNERKAISNIVARRVMGADSESQGFKFPKIFSRIEFASIVKSAANLTWGIFSGFISFLPQIVICFVGVGIVKYFVGDFLNYFMLGNVVSIRSTLVTIGGSFWNTLTRLILLRSSQKPPDNQKQTSTSNALSKPFIVKNNYTELEMENDY